MFRPFAKLTSFPDALASLEGLLPAATVVETVRLNAAGGRVLAKDLASGADVPAFDRCAMDGYAVRSADVAKATKDRPVTLPVVAEAHAGDPARTVKPGSASQVATGAILPKGTDAVVMAEHAVRDGTWVRISSPVPRGAHVSVRGGDFRTGDILLRAGRPIDAAGISLAASHGFDRLPVLRRPRIAIVPSGSEVVEPGRPLAEGQVYDSNSRALEALATRLGADVERLPPMPDVPEAHRAALEAASKGRDLLVVTGGTSVGERDLLAPLVAARGDVLVHGLRLRPGKPVLVGRWGKVPVLGLPGYPASTLVTGEVLLAPAVRRLTGARPRPRIAARAAWADAIEVRSDLTTVIPVRVEDGRARSTYKESGTVTSVVESDGYVLFPEGSTGAKSGDLAEVIPWSWA